ncbi:hypothetical protein AVEN_181130-1 [Araneus ventricosus]|uniref:Uncharacterized protein n=1 Tax=Araneus ventricosus TaxID=182803 RepID=A0A4Y2HLV7_ARAVE|nr:hypothetical protein AVEN_181130-1 [Araneus ventricosus]
MVDSVLCVEERIADAGGRHLSEMGGRHCFLFSLELGHFQSTMARHIGPKKPGVLAPVRRTQRNFHPHPPLPPHTTMNLLTPVSKSSSAINVSYRGLGPFGGYRPQNIPALRSTLGFSTESSWTAEN